jgi:hypothetical protein
LFEYQSEGIEVNGSELAKSGNLCKRFRRGTAGQSRCASSLAENAKQNSSIRIEKRTVISNARFPKPGQW